MNKTAIICGMDAEAYVAKQVFKNSDIIQYQHKPGFSLPAVQYDRAWSFGVCGGNRPGLPYGALAIGDSMQDDRGLTYRICYDLENSVWKALSEASIHFLYAHWLSTDKMNLGTTPVSRAELFKKYGADVVDDESYWIAKWADERKIPFGIFRTLSDDWTQTLPPFINGALTPEGKTNWEFIGKTFGGDPSAFRAAINMAWCYEYSLNTLLFAATAVREAMEVQ